jgi:DNA-binding MarR family transcriptional regulator
VDHDPDALATALERLIVMVRRLTPPEGLSLTAVSTLRTIQDYGPTRLSELAATQGVTQPAMTQLVTRLERDGYARRGGHPDDARVVLVSLTEAGAELLLRRRATRTRVLRELIDKLPGADQDLVYAAVPAMNLLADMNLLGDPAQPEDRSAAR